MMTLQQGMERLERIELDYKFELGPCCIELVQGYIARMKQHRLAVERPLLTPFTDITTDYGIELPGEFQGRLGRLLSQWGPLPSTVGEVCRWYLRDLYGNELGLTGVEESVYEPLIQVLEDGEFFVDAGDSVALGHHGSVRYLGC